MYMYNAHVNEEVRVSLFLYHLFRFLAGSLMQPRHLAELFEIGVTMLRSAGMISRLLWLAA